MITEIIKILPLTEGKGKLTSFAKGEDSYPTTFKELVKWIKRFIKWRR